MNTLTLYITIFLLSINLIDAKEQDGCKDKSNDGLLLLIALVGCAYLYQQHKMHEEDDYAEEEESSGEDESEHSDEEEEEGEDTEEEMEDEQDDDDDGDNGHPSEEEGDESEEETESVGEPTAIVRKRRSSRRLGSKAMGLESRD